MKSNSYRHQSILSAFIFAVLVIFSFSHTASAAEMEVSSESSNRYYELKAKIAYLTEFLSALQDGDLSPRPTLVSVSGGNGLISIFGTLARDSQPDVIEVCGPMIKGVIDWGDEIITPIMGLGCSGNVHAFAVSHQYEESGSFKIRVEDAEDRDDTHVVAVRVAE